jgi:hypothetical protein
VTDTPAPEDGDEKNTCDRGDDASEAASSPAPSLESGEASPIDPATAAENSSADAPGKPNETAAAAPPLPNEPPPSAESGDDGWDYHWDEANQAYYFHNHITGESTWENPRLRGTTAATTTSAASAATAAPAPPPQNERPPAGGYNPAIHGDYDPNAWYAQGGDAGEEGGANGEASSAAVDPDAAYAAIGSFNRFTGRWQQGAGGGGSANPEQHSDENKSRRQMNAYFDVDAAANAHDGRSLKAERAGKKPSKAELKQFKEKRRAKKEEKRRAWLRD